MYAPVHLPPAPPVADRVRQLEAAILRTEGPYTVAGVYCGSEADAATRRRAAAEKLARREQCRGALALHTEG